MKRITLYQPRHIFAPEEGDGHIYLPSSLTTVAARVLAAGGEVDIQDGNLQKLDFQGEILGVNVIGSPYIPEVIDVRKQIEDLVGDDAQILLGGQVIGGLLPDQFERLFGENCIDGNDDKNLKKALGMRLRQFPVLENVSHIPAYEQISDEHMKKYLAHEFCLYIAQGCKYACDFCGARRTRTNPQTGEKVVVREQYRNLETVDQELRYLVERARKLGLEKLEIYLSSLDIFQTPAKLKELARNVNVLKRDYPGFEIRMRGLSNTKEFMLTYRNDPDTIREMVDAGLWSIGFGVDGTSKEVWKSIRKGQNRMDDCLDAIRLTREEFGILPEVFMVAGHEHDTHATLHDNVQFVMDMIERFSAAPRPYVSKAMVPGNSGWYLPENADLVEALIQHPEYFVALDYAALPTSFSHRDAEMRRMVRETFLMMTELPGNTTRPIYPLAPEIDDVQAAVHRRLNVGRFDR